MQSKIQLIKFFAFLMLIFLLAQSAVCNGGPSVNTKVPESATAKSKAVDETSKKASAHIPPEGQKNEQHNKVLPEDTVINSESNKTAGNITSKFVNVNTTELQNKHIGVGRATLNAGALRRGFYVFAGLSVLCMAYIVFRSFRLSKTRAQMIRKYGVLAHRQDVEMRPLPLDEEDDEDTTVFDASNVLTNNVQR